MFSGCEEHTLSVFLHSTKLCSGTLWGPRQTKCVLMVHITIVLFLIKFPFNTCLQ